MRIAKRAIALALTLTVASTSAVVPVKKADAAKTYNTYLMYTDSTWEVQNFNKKVGNIKVKNKKGKQSYTVTLKKSQCTKSDLKAKATGKIKATTVFCIDFENMIKDYKPKKVKISNVVIKRDGKTVKIKSSKLLQGWIENKTSKNYRLEIYNEYGDSKKSPCAKNTAFNFKKQLSVSFDITMKK